MSPHKDTKANLLLNFWGSAECTWREINLCFKWDWNPGHFNFLSIALTNRWSTCNPLLYTLFYLNLHYSTMALLHFYSTSLYHDSILLYLTVHHSIIALDHSSSLYHGSTGFYFTVCMFPEVIEMLHGIVPVLSLLHSALWLLWALSTA